MNEKDIQLSVLQQRLFEELNRSCITQVELEKANQRIEDLEAEIDELTSGDYSVSVEEK